MGATAVIDDESLVGIITDGDIRRMLENEPNWSSFSAKDIMTPNPILVNDDDLAANALKIMKQNNISQIILTRNSKYIGIVHIHDLLKEGLI